MAEQTTELTALLTFLHCTETENQENYTDNMIITVVQSADTDTGTANIDLRLCVCSCVGAVAV